ncbi:phosphatidylserine/phosphatidylglycerophosphate/cardiolipin synthase family protein [uncultured Azohydromonas sp.]|jgi:Phosphatidylserine/phosphatidylglycerophosphate/cardiolipin synthases and related enzymes|uniref:phospholipase D-like domain-containing protein n=1 Tax=uncultured Azohydromonas sp. TaxID=487342 RepID=UPI002625116B|nr:phospholipase D-like domain-containing protein [uncultured Azohydromonas sp.]
MSTTPWCQRLLCLLLCLWLAGCGGLPSIVPDMAVQRRPVQIEGARGPLTAAQSKAILERLQARGTPTDVLDRHLALEEALVGSPLVAGNRAQLLQNGPATYEAMFSAIRAARDHVNVEFYILEDDEVGQRFRELLLERQRAGAQVNLLYDSVGSLRTPKSFFDPLREAGARVLEFNPVNPLKVRRGWNVNQRDHRKLVVVDGRVAFLGGINISSVYSGGSLSGSRGRSVTEQQQRQRERGALPWRDTQVQIEGPAVAEFQRLFMQTWSAQHGPELPARDYFPTLQPQGREVVRAIGSSPDEPYSFIYATLISALRSAETEILITTAYFVPDPQLLETLQEAAGRGVKVKMLLPSRSDSAFVLAAGRAYYQALLDAGVELYERHEALLHAKTAVIDGVWSTVGSTNLDWRSFLHNQELNAVVLGPGFGARMREVFNADLAASRRIEPAEWASRSWKQRLAEQAARLWAWWL